MRRRFRVVPALLLCVSISASAQNGTSSSLRKQYRALPKEQCREFLKKLTANQMDQFIHETVQVITKGKKPNEILQGWQFLAMSTGS